MHTTSRKLYSVVTVGERGQVVIPQDAREELEIHAGDKMLILGGMFKFPGIILVKSEHMMKFISEAIDRFNVFGELVRKSENEEE